MLKNIKTLQLRLKNSKDGKALASNFGYMMLLQVAGYIFPLLTIPYLVRVIGVEGFGKLAFAAAVILWLQTITDWGFNYSATRDVAKNREDFKKISEIFSNVFWAKVLLTVLSFGLLLLLIATIPLFKENQTILLITFLLIPGHIMFPEWLFQALERMKFITIFNVLSKALFTVLVFVFINNKEDYILQPIFMSLGYLTSGLIALYIIIIKWKIKIKPPKWQQIKQTIINSTDIFINSLMPNLYNSFSTVLLGFYGSNLSVGLLDIGRKLVEISQQFLTIISRVFFPFLSRREDKHHLYMRLHLALAILFFLLLNIAAPSIISIIFTEESQPAILILRIMSISIIFLSLSNIYGTNFLIIKGYEKTLRNLTIFSSCIGFFISIPLIYYFDYIGAAVTISLTRVILGSAISIKALKLIQINPNK